MVVPYFIRIIAGNLSPGMEILGFDLTAPKEKDMVFKPQTFHDIPPQSEIDDPTSSHVEADVAEALARTGALDASRVEVTAANGAITLQGFVTSSREIDAATEVARCVEGVKVVNNKLMVETGLG